MIWFYATIGSALIWFVLSLISKKMMQGTSALVFTTLYTFTATLFYLPIFIYMMLGTSPDIGLYVLGAAVFSVLANTAGIMAYNTSIKEGELSTVVPLTKLIPIFVAINGFIFLGEAMTLQTVAGIGLVTLGSYIVLLRKGTGALEPLKNLKARPEKMAVLSALVYSFAAIADRFATQRLGPEIYTFLIYIGMSINFGIYQLKNREKDASEIKRQLTSKPVAYALVGMIAATGSFLIFVAFSLAPASKVIPVLQIQVLLTVLAGGYMFREAGIGRKILGTVLLIAGVALTAL